MPISRISATPESIELSRLIFGTWRLKSRPETGTVEGVARLIALCLEHGVTSFDLADIYGDYQIEELFGQALQGFDRQSVELITKCGIKLPSAQRPEYGLKIYDSSPAYVRWSVEQSLRKLRTDYLDMILLHRPDFLLDADGVARVAQDLMMEGKIRAFGVSNFTRHQCDLLLSRVPGLISTNQVEAHLLHLDPFLDGVLDHAQEHRYLPMIWSPLAGGRIWSKDSPRGAQLRATLATLAQGYNCSEEAIVLAWLLKHPALPLPVLGSGDPHRMLRMFEADGIELQREDWYRLLTAAWGRNIP
jgi:predicted oxidoreductase